MSVFASKSPDSSPTVVGIGASAGGLAALEKLFEKVPPDSGLAFVVVVHLSPERKSHLADLLQTHSPVPVQQVTETVRLEPNRIYVIPPNANLEAVDTHLRLAPLEERRRERAPIDHFFRTLACTHDGQSIGIILTGTGTDGALGIREIKGKQGFTIAQDPSEAEYEGMPQSAIATGMIDLILPLDRIPEAVLRVAKTEPRVAVPANEEDVDGEARQALQHVFARIRASTGRDFSRYKRSTILRRIARRMRLHQVEDLSAYLTLLRKKPDEVHRLADDLLITVTSFFRDSEVFQRLEEDVVPKLLEGKGSGDEIRVWSVGCATGEEAYSTAIVLLEEEHRRQSGCRIQIFASDLHEHSLARAREGFFPGEIDSVVSPQRLERFFAKESGGYRIRKEVRETVVFAPHNLLADPPFSRIDLVLCRNVLIYLQREIQRDVIDLFHYALRRDGYLILGTSENVDGADLFTTEDKKRGVYRKRNVARAEPRLPVFPLSKPKVAHEYAPFTDRFGDPIPVGLYHQWMVERYAPPSLLFSPEDQILHLSEHAGRFLLHPGGELTARGLKLVREELRVELRSLLHEAREKQRPVRSRPIMVRFDEESRPVVLDVRPSLEPGRNGFALVIFDERAAVTEEDEPEESSASHVELGRELDLARQRLQSIIEEYETGQEEMRASNEELQSANEELRSTLEELETSKEELQSLNEELHTVNQENRHKVEELAQLTDDLQNLLVSTDIATLFLDRGLRILRFTPKVGEIFNIRGTDRGRPISELKHNLGDDLLLIDARSVLETLIPVQREVKDEAGGWYLARVRPYRSAGDQISGVVLTMVDITERKLGEEALRASEARTAAELSAMSKLHALVTKLLTASDLRSALHEVLEGSTEITAAQMGHVLLWNPASERLEFAASKGFSPEQLDSVRSVGLDARSVAATAGRTRQRVIVPDLRFDSEHASATQEAGGEYRGVQSTPLLSRDGRLLGVLSTHYREPLEPSERDLRMLDLYARQAADFIEHVQNQESLRAKTAALEEEDARKERFLAVLGHELRNPLAALDGAMKTIDLGLRSEAELRPKMMCHLRQLMHLIDDLLDLSRISRGKVRLKKSQCDLSALVGQAATAVEVDVAAKQQTLALSLPPQLLLNGDPTRLIQVATNLLSNASRYTPDHGHIEVVVERDHDRALLSVKDDGRGLPLEHLPGVFEAFRQGDPGTGGRGIGLALVRDLVELHGGAVRAQSAGPDQGSTFTVELPIEATKGAPVELPPQRDGVHFPRPARMLVIDDLQDAAESLSMVLRHGGAETAAAYTGAAGLQLARSWRPEIVLVDIALPDMTGYDVARQIREKTLEDGVLLVALTGFGDAATAEQAAQAGFDHRLVKPVDLDRLFALISEHLQHGSVDHLPHRSQSFES